MLFNKLTYKVTIRRTKEGRKNEKEVMAYQENGKVVLCLAKMDLHAMNWTEDDIRTVSDSASTYEVIAWKTSSFCRFIELKVKPVDSYLLEPLDDFNNKRLRMDRGLPFGPLVWVFDYEGKKYGRTETCELDTDIEYIGSECWIDNSCFIIKNLFKEPIRSTYVFELEKA